MNDLKAIPSLMISQRQGSSDDPEPQLIAAFHENNHQCKQAGLQVLKHTLMPAIAMVGTSLTFYHIQLSTKLLNALATASFPEDQTIVLKFIPPIPNAQHYSSDGMHVLENRHIALQCFQAFKTSSNLTRVV